MSRKSSKNDYSRLLVIIPDRLSELVAKGEIIERYYNPGNLFQEVHLIMTSDDQVDYDKVKIMVGDARLYLYNLPIPCFKRTLGWQPILMSNWIRSGVQLARDINPVLVRSYNNFIEGYLAKLIKDDIGVPYVISLHGVWDRDCLITRKDKVLRFFKKKFEKISLKHSDAVICVYKPIMRYAKEYGARNVRLVYNAVSNNVEVRSHYRLDGRPKLITINRQLKEKNPENIIRAIQDLDCTYLVVGDGEYHEHLIDVARNCGCLDKVEFVKAMPNKELCTKLKDFDIMVSHCDYWGMSKTVIEASLAGLPIIINRHPVEAIPEYDGDWLIQCDNTPDGYRQALQQLLASDSLRFTYGKNAREHALRNFHPDVMENSVVQIYKKAIGQ